MLDFAFTDAFTPKLQAAARAAVDFSRPMAVIADYMRSETVLNFETETGPDGKRWLPSARALADGGLTLTDTGHLRGSITAGSDATTAIVGTNLIYAAIHQFGGAVRGRASRRSQNVPKPRQFPARPFIGFSPANAAHIEKILANHITAAFAAGGPA